MTWLSTALQLLLCGITVYAAYRALRSEHYAEAHAKDLLQSKGRLIANEHAIAELHTRHLALNGRVNAVVHRVKREHVDDDDPPARDERQPELNGLDPDLAAALALQNAPTAAPGK